jgi:hypothetical protein
VEEEAYKVGPRRPPKEHRWKPGQSGNPKGAKRKARSLLPDLKEIFALAFNQKAKVTQGERHARRDAFWIADRLGSDFLTSNNLIEPLVGDRQATLDAYVARQTRENSFSAASPVLAPSELLDEDEADEGE